MNRFTRTVAVAIGLTLTFAVSAQAKPPEAVQWVCQVPGVPEPEVFVTAAEAARYGIDTANNHAGQVFLNQFGEVCTVV